MICNGKRSAARKAAGIIAAVLVLQPVPVSFAQEKPAAMASSAMYPAAESRSGESVNAAAPVKGSFIKDLSGSTWLKPIEMERGEIPLVSGRSHLLRLQRKIGRISLSNPGIVDAVILSPTEVLLNAKSEGAANVILWDHQNEVTALDVTVTKNPNLLHAVLKRIAPETTFEIFPSNEVFVVKGEVETVEQRKEVERAANAFAEGSVSLVSIRKAKQVLLKIRFVELDRSRGLDFGVDLEYDPRFDRSIQTHRFLPGSTNAETTGDATAVLTNLSSQLEFDIFGRNDTDVYQFQRFTDSGVIQGYLKAIETEGVGKIIARPNLLASDGEEASFLVGGEAAVVAISADNVGVEYREFGTRLTFTPQILSDGRIRLTVAPEVSALDFANGVTVNDVVIPSFTTVRTKTVVELGDQETLMIGGLLQQKLTETNSGVPFLRRLPLIGKLFESSDMTYQETELLVIVTPVLVNPLPGGEGEPLPEILEEATQFHPVEEEPDGQRDAVRQFIEDQDVSITEKVKKLKEKEIVAVDIQGPKEFKSLEELEAQLKWKKARAGEVPKEAKAAPVMETFEAQPADIPPEIPLETPPDEKARNAQPLPAEQIPVNETVVERQAVENSRKQAPVPMKKIPVQKRRIPVVTVLPSADEPPAAAEVLPEAVQSSTVREKIPAASNFPVKTGPTEPEIISVDAAVDREVNARSSAAEEIERIEAMVENL